MRSLIVNLAIVIVCLWPMCCLSQTAPKETTDQILLRAETVAGNIQTAISVHLTEDENFITTKQQPEQRKVGANILVKKDGSWYFDQTPGQHARDLMENLRQGIHALQSAVKPRGMDAPMLSAAREYWSKVRDISCHESPGTRYYDLDGSEEFCPER